MEICEICETYLVLQTCDAENTKQVLCLKDGFEGKPSDYFVGSPAAEIIGEVTLDGKLVGHELLANSFTSDR